MSDRIYGLIARRLPRRLVYWVAIRILAAATIAYPRRTPDDISILDVLEAI